MKSLLWLLALTSTAAAQAACAGQELRATTLDGSLVSLCPDSEYNGATSRIISRVASGRQCFDLCLADAACSVAEYKESVQWCLFKKVHSQPRAEADSKYDLFQVLQRAVPGRALSACPQPVSQYATANGAKWAVCLGSDYQGPTTQRLVNVWSNEQCADVCSDTAGCTHAVWEYAANVCHLKGSPTGLRWAQDNRYSTISQISGPKK